jgi:hypothetical protein
MGRRRPRLSELAAVLGLLVLAALIVLLASPIHRSFYLGAGVEGMTGRAFPLPSLPGLMRADRPVVAPVAVKRRMLAPDAEGRLLIPVADEIPAHLPASGVPRGWELKEFTGKADVELARAEGGVALRLRSDRTSFALYRDVVVDVEQAPMLSWSWKVVRLPAHGDVRQTGTDDQAAQLYVVFPRWPSLRMSSDVIGYIWDTTTPAGAVVTSARAPNVKIIVVESGSARTGEWLRYQRNVHEDYVSLFQTRPPRAGVVAFMTDANDTGSTAEAWMGEVVFAPRALDGRKSPTSMLR